MQLLPPAGRARPAGSAPSRRQARAALPRPRPLARNPRRWRPFPSEPRLTDRKRKWGRGRGRGAAAAAGLGPWPPPASTSRTRPSTCATSSSWTGPEVRLLGRAGPGRARGAPVRKWGWSPPAGAGRGRRGPGPGPALGHPCAPRDCSLPAPRLWRPREPKTARPLAGGGRSLQRSLPAAPGGGVRRGGAPPGPAA